MRVTELSKTKAAVWCNLGNAKFRKKHGAFLAEGKKCVVDTFRHFNPLGILVNEDSLKDINSLIPDIIREASDKGILFSVSPQEMKKISNLSTPSEIIAIYSLPENKEIPDFLPEKPILMLDGVRDPGNLGTIIRTAHWFGINNILCSPDCVDIYNPKTVQSTMGSIAAVNVVYTPLEEIMQKYPHRPVCGLVLNGENIFEKVLPKNPFIVMGNEGTGISKNLTKKINLPLTIPPADPYSHPDSLNVAIATAITIAAFVK